MDLKRLSKTLAHALRHEPWLYELEPDPRGWVPLATLLQALRERKPRYRGVTEYHVRAMMARADKRRFELRNGYIRALYGHSIPGRLRMEPAQPPPTLYHGTAPRTADQVLAEGLQPMGRQYVHLSTDRATAIEVGRRKSPRPVVLQVDAGAAQAAGITFYRGNDRVWLADRVPATYLIRE